jgi:hypothetical protein
VDREALARTILEARAIARSIDPSSLTVSDVLEHGLPIADYVIASGKVRDAAEVWDETVAAVREVMLRRKGTYEADIDILSMPCPYRSAS